MPRALNSQETLTVAAKAKPDGARPYVYDSGTGKLSEISKEFEAFLILAPAGIKARAAQFIANIILFDINNLTIRNNLLKRWAEDEIADLDNEIKAYQDILDTYDNIIPKLADAKTGFEDVPEVNTLLSSFILVVGDFGEQRDSLRFDKAVASVIVGRDQGALPSSIKQEIESYAKALLTYG